MYFSNLAVDIDKVVADSSLGDIVDGKIAPGAEIAVDFKHWGCLGLIIVDGIHLNVC